MAYYHMRVTINKADVSGFLDAFLKKYKPDQVACYFENKEKDGKANPHIHTHLRYPTATAIPKKSTLSDFMKSAGYAGKYYHKAVKTTAVKNLGYVSKGGDKQFIKNITDDELEEAIDSWTELGEVMEMKMIDRLKIAVEHDIKLKVKHRFSTLKKLICEYHRKNGMLVPPTGLLMQYTVSISIDLGIAQEDLELYYGI